MAEVEAVFAVVGDVVAGNVIVSAERVEVNAVMVIIAGVIISDSIVATVIVE